MRLHLSLAASLLCVCAPMLTAQAARAQAPAAPKATAPKTTATKPAPRRYYYRRPAPLVIPDNYIVRPQLADLPDLVPPLPQLDPTEISDSFTYRRYDGKVHWGIDIFRPLGTPLHAMVDGVVRLAELPLGGLAVYLTDATSEFRFYYAHLDAYPEGLRTGSRVRQGDIIGYVGTSGNARGTRPHLHFEIHVIAPWMLDEIGRVPAKAGSLNPAPILKELLTIQALPSGL